MYAPHAQELLRRRRMATVPVEDMMTPEEDDDDGEEDRALHIPKYALVPLGRETPGPKYLADRRKGLPSLYEGAAPVQLKRKAKVKQVLADGSEHIIEVLVPEGQTIPGEISVAVAPEVTAETLPAGTVVEGVGVANNEGVVVAAAEATTPQSNRRKPPPPKKRKVHPLKGRKKKVMLEVPKADGTVELVESAASGGTPRPDDEDGDDDDEGEEGAEDGEATGEEASPTPGNLSTPNVFVEPPRSVTAEEPNTSANGSEQVDKDMGTGATQAEAAVETKESLDKTYPDAMEVDTLAAEPATEPVPEPATEPAPALASAIVAGSELPIESSQAPLSSESFPAPDASTEPPAVSPPTDAIPATTSARAEQIEESLQSIESTGTSENFKVDALPPTSTSEIIPPTDAPVPAPVEIVPTLIAGIESTDRKESAAISEPSVSIPNAPVPVSDEPIASSEAETAAPGAVAVIEPSTEPVPDAVPDALKPEEVALSNPTEDEAEKLAEKQQEQEEKKDEKKVEEQPDILGSLEKSLG